MNLFLISLLNHFKITLKDLEAREETRSFIDLKRPYNSLDFQSLIKKLLAIRNSGDKIVIYGDYDVDGITATAILKMTFDRIGLKAGFYIPNRYLDGYGLNKNRINEFKAKDYKFILTVDNGINSCSSIQYAHSLGMEVLVVDHHEPNDQIAETTKFIFHQKLSKFIDYNCSAASLAYFIASYLLQEDVEYFATLAGLAVFSDVMPMIGNNLIFAKLALVFLTEKRYPNLTYLLNHKYNLNYDDFNFTLIPILNAAGRISNDILSTNNVCRFLMSFSNDKIITFGNKLINFNDMRKEMVNKINKDNAKCFSTSHAKAYILDGCLSGLSGLLANRFMREDKVPIMILMPDEKDAATYIGSIRSFYPYPLTGFVEKYSSLFVNIGGHEFACGFTIEKTKLIQIITQFLSEMEKNYLSNAVEDENLIEISLEDLTLENYDIYSKFMPFGNAFEKPRFKIEVAKENLFPSKNNKALFAFSPDKKGKLVYFGSDDFLASIDEESISFIGYLEKDTFNDNVTICLKCHEYRKP